MLVNTKYGEVYILTRCPTLDSTESLEFKTEVHEAFDSTESRYSLREHARQILKFSYQQAFKEMGDMFHILYARLRGQFGIPLLHLSQSIPDVADSNFIPFDTTLIKADFHVGYALIYANNTVTPVEITQIGRDVADEGDVTHEDGFLLASNVTVSNAKLSPLRICIINGDASATIGGYWSRQNLTFNVLAEDCPYIEPNYDQQYQGYDIYFNNLLSVGGTLEATLSQQQNIVDGETGGFQSFTQWKNPKYAKPLITEMKNKTQLFEYREFLFRRMGRLNAFWMPLFERHLNIIAKGANWIEVDNVQVNTSNRQHLAIKIGDTWTAHAISSIVVTAGKARITFTPPVSGNIENACYLGLYRLDTDNIDFEYKGNDVSASTVQIIEIQS